MADLLARFIAEAEETQRAQALAARYTAASSKDAAITLDLNLVIDGIAVPQAEAAALQRAVASVVRAQLPNIMASATAAMQAKVANTKEAARAEFTKLFGAR